MRTAAIVAGVSLFMMAVLAPIADFIIGSKLVVDGDVVATVANIKSSIALFRTGIALFTIVILLDIFVAWGLYVFLKPANTDLAALVAWLRIAYAAVFFVVLLDYVNVLNILQTLDLNNAQYNQVMFNLDEFKSGWEISLIVFGFHLLVLGGAIFVSGYMPKLLGILVGLASLGYIVDGFGKILMSNYNLGIIMYTFIGEVVLLFWLLIRGVQIKREYIHVEKG